MSQLSLNSSLLKPNNKYIKVYKEDFVVIEGPNTKNKLSFSNLQIPYEQYLYTEVMLQEDSYHHEIPYGALGDGITILILRVSYIPVVKTLTPDPEVPTLEYFYQTNENEIRNVDSLLILSGTKDKKLPKIFINNPNKKFRAKVEILAATQEVVFNTVVEYVPINENVFTVQDLLYTNIVSDELGYGLIIQKDSNTPIANLALDRISNIEIRGRLLIIDDTAIGKVNLFFIDEFNCLQAFSLINWAMKDLGTNIITSSTVADLTSPLITYSPDFTTDLLLFDYPVGTSGTAGYSITKQTILDLFISSVADDRDGTIIIDTSNVTITKLNQTLKRETISEIGKYSLTIDVFDLAGNKTSDSFILNITDNIPAQVIISEFGYELVQNSTSGTGGTSGFASQTPVFLQDFSLNVIDKQDLIDLLIANIFDITDGVISPTVNNIEVTITDYNGFTIIDEIDAPGYYDVYFQVVDRNDNISTSLWRDINTELRDLSDNTFTNISIEIRENAAPVVFFNTVSDISISLYGGVITKSILENVLINNVVDDRDGIITTNILNISLFKTHYWDVSTSGTAGVVVVDNLNNTYVFEPLPEEVEMISTSVEGIYKIKVLIADSDGALTLQEVSVNILT